MGRLGSGRVPSCHPDRKHRARGLCDYCYKVAWWKKAQARFKELRKAYYLRHQEAIKAKAKNRYEHRDVEQWATKARSSHLRRKYGISQVDYDALLKQQGGVCGICGTDAPKGRGRFHVDHDHTVSPVMVRGLLCASCNFRLGWFEQHGHSIKSYLERKTHES